MPKQNDYAWQRYWCPRDGTFSIGQHGYIEPPSSNKFLSAVSQLRSFAEIDSERCLILLGEPGMGKTHEIDAATRVSIAAGQEVLSVDLGLYSSDFSLLRNSFESEAYLRWLTSDHTLCLYFDGLDECRLRVNNVATIIAAHLKNCPAERLILRIACRTAEWPAILEDALKELWAGVQVYEIVPLTRNDVMAAASASNIRADEFLAEVARITAEPFAAKPVTLRSLLGTFKRTGGRLPSTQLEMYEDGCRELCTEANPSRTAARDPATTTTDQRLVIASRIAAITQFGNRSLIFAGEALLPDGSVSISDLSGGKEAHNADQFSVTETAVRETLNTGLFSGRGDEPGLLGWAHKTYAEFLAARYLHKHSVTLQKAISLISHSDDPALGIVPQLNGTITWLCAFDQSIRDFVLRADPLLLLQSDITASDDALACRLLGRLMDAAASKQIQPLDILRSGAGHNLRCTTMAEHLRLVLTDSSEDVNRRFIALEFAEECRVATVQTEIAYIALSVHEPIELRKQASSALYRIGDNATKSLLNPLAQGGAEDKDDELKGYALLALWPGGITIDQLLPLLTEPKRGNLWGSYKHFLNDAFAPGISLAELPRALEWVRNLPSSRADELSAFSEAAVSIVSIAFRNLRDPSILNLVADVIEVQIKRYRVILPLVSDADEDIETRLNRRALIALLASRPREDSNRREFAYRLTHSSGGHLTLVRQSDIDWLWDQIAISDDLSGPAYASLIYHVGDIWDEQFFERLCFEYPSFPLLTEFFAPFLGPIDLDSPTAVSMRDYHDTEKEYYVEPEPEIPTSDVERRLDEALEKCESGELDAWWRMFQLLSEQPNGMTYRAPFQEPITKMRGWTVANSSLQRRILDAAARYINEYVPEYNWVGTSKMRFPEWAAYRALDLLLQERPTIIETLPKTLWERWAPVTVAFSSANVGEDPGRELQLAHYASAAAPEAMWRTMETLIISDYRKFKGLPLFLHRRGNFLTQQLAERLFFFLETTRLRNAGIRAGLTDLILSFCIENPGNDILKAKVVQFAKKRITFGTPIRDSSLAMAEAVFRADPVGSWELLWPTIEQNTEFAKIFVEKIVWTVRRDQNTLRKISVMRCAKLFAWLEMNFPHERDPEFRSMEMHKVQAREEIAHWRDGILQDLTTRGTADACSALRFLIRELPELRWLPYVLNRCEEALRRDSWRPPSPESVMRIANDGNARLVTCADHLQTVVLESLGRLQQRLQGETPSAEFLWDGAKPKLENSLSNFVKVHLEQDIRDRGIILAREVQIRQPGGSKPGETTDIHVDAFARRNDGSAFDVVTVIIESKGCWNAGLFTSMETQLVERYLNANNCRNGIYLVGWYVCKFWDQADSRYQSTPKISIGDVRRRLVDQATDLSDRMALRVDSIVLDASR